MFKLKLLILDFIFDECLIRFLKFNRYYYLLIISINYNTDVCSIIYKLKVLFLAQKRFIM